MPVGISTIEKTIPSLTSDAIKAMIEQKTTVLNQEINLLRNKIDLLETFLKQEKTTEKREPKVKK